jgi:hypothetical protein
MRLGAELADLVARLAAAIGARPAAPPRDGLDWSAWLDLVHEHDLAPFLHARGGDVPAQIADELRGDYVRWAHTTAFRAGELGAILDALGPIEAIALKGSALALTLYDESAERVMSDVDLLVVDGDSRLRAVERLAPLGYAVVHPDAPATNHDLALWGAVQELEVDLHINLTRPALPDEAMADLWQRRVATGALGGRLVVLDPVWCALHAALHALSDPIGSPLLRNLLEVGWMATRLGEPERAALVDRARRFGVADPAARAFALAHRLFGTPALLGVPRASAWELWSWHRLSWRYGGDDRRSRLVQHVAELHLRRLRDGRGHGLDPRPLLSTALATAASAATEAGRRLALRLRPRAPTLERTGAAAARVGDGLLLHVDSGDVHLLDADAARAWDAADHASGTADELTSRLAASGMPAPRARAAVAALVERALLTTV